MPIFCPICGNRTFEDFRGRSKVRCVGCGSLERHRLFALLALDCLPDIGDRPIHLLAPGTELARIKQVAPSRFKVCTPAEILAADRIDALLLRHEFEAFDMPVDRLFAELRRKMPAGGIVGFTYEAAAEGPDYEVRKVEDQEGKPRLQFNFGPTSWDWFQKMPGWKMSIWQPSSRFGAAAEADMALSYKSGKFYSNRIIIARSEVM